MGHSYLCRVQSPERREKMLKMKTVAVWQISHINIMGNKIEYGNEKGGISSSKLKLSSIRHCVKKHRKTLM